jgi:hypothetical protein
VKSNEVFPSKTLKAADIGEASPVVTIHRVELESIDKNGKDKKPVAYFVGKDKGLVLNKTNWRAIVKISGQDDSDLWEGVKIQLFVTDVDFQGDLVPAIRVRAPKNGSAKTAKAAPTPEPEDDFLASDEEIPF